MAERNETLSRLRALIAAYLDTVAELEAKRRPADGLLGLRPGPADDPCHDRFAEQVSALLADYAAQAPSSAEAAAVLRELYAAAPAHRDAKSAYWMLMAVQGAGLPLIERLEPSDASELYAFFEKSFPRRERFPVQKQTLQSLKKQSIIKK